MSESVSLRKYILIKLLAIKAKRAEPKPEPPPLDSLKRERVRQSFSTVIKDNRVIVNGVEVKPGTPEYERAMASGMAGLSKGMKALGQSMKTLESLGDDLSDLFKDL